MNNVHSRAIVPVRFRSIARFAGPNPWMGAASTEWSIEVYRMVQERYASLVEQNPTGRATDFVAPKREALGIRSDADGRYHMIPVILAQLWQSKLVNATQLPRLIHAIEPELQRTDYVPFFGVGTSPALQNWACGIILGLGVVLLGVYLFLVPPASHSSVNITTQEWLSHPVTGSQAWYVSQPVQIEGAVQAPSAVKAPAGVTEIGYNSGSLIGWYKAAEGHRLALIGNDFRSEIPRLRLSGIVLKTSEIGLPPRLLQQIASKAPDINTEYIFCTHWDWENQYSIMSQVAPVLLWGGIGSILMSARYFVFFSRYSKSLRRN
jgi:hypothetical protein